MKVKIGGYLNWYGPYQLVAPLKYIGVSEKNRDKIADFLCSKTPLEKLCQWVYSKRKRTIKVKIHPHDTWGMDSTLALIILPMLKQLKATKNGSQIVEEEDVPEELKNPTNMPEDESWNIIEKQWNWVMNEMIWAFEQLQPGCDWESAYYTGNPNAEFIEYGGEKKVRTFLLENISFGEVYKIHSEGMKKHQERITRGTILFGKYYQGLWD
jgi:hypothetical protein